MKKILFLALALLAAPAVCVRAEDSAAKLALAHEAISAMQADKIFDGMSGQIKQMAMQIAPLPEGTSPEAKKQFDDYMTKVMDLTMGEMKGMIAKMDSVYAEVFTEAELKAITAFYKSPEGQSMIAKQPQVMAHLMPMVQNMQQTLVPKLEALAEEFKNKLPAPAAAPAQAADKK